MRFEREPGEDAAALEVGVGGGVHRTRRVAHATTRTHQLPTQERAEPDDAFAGERDPHRRLPERVLEVLPLQEPRIVVDPTERAAEQLEHRGNVVARRATRDDVVDHRV